MSITISRLVSGFNSTSSIPQSPVGPQNSYSATHQQPPIATFNPCSSTQSSFSILPTLSLPQPAMLVPGSANEPDSMDQSSSQPSTTEAVSLSSLGPGQLSSPWMSDLMSNVSITTALELLVPNHPFGYLLPCRRGCYDRVYGIACSTCLVRGMDNPYVHLFPLDRVPSREPDRNKGSQLILDEKLGVLYSCLRHGQTFCQLQRDKKFNKSTISRIVKDPKVKKWLVRVLVYYPKDERLYRWLRILHPFTSPNDPKDSRDFKKLKKPMKSNESLYREWWDIVSPDLIFEKSPGASMLPSPIL
ncbi:MAG: hypothetical protein J3Q66DRAFT_385162 [Benniella sp.]|nr:MAG: hypothetical protein J3Q66DRAFT_385162 [Benniella sp.]